jgi:HJR/Mrr/RecB family endonuclease
MIDLNYDPSLGSTCLGLLIFGLVIFVLATGAAFGKEMLDENRNRAHVNEILDMARIEKMTQRQFRDFVAGVMRKQGHEVSAPRDSDPDAGMALIAAKDGRRLAVLAVHYAKAISAPTVSEALTAQARLGCDGAMVVTNGTFAQAAQELGAARGCELVDRAVLAQWFEGSMLGRTATAV